MNLTSASKNLYTAEQVRALDHHIIQNYAIPGIELMQRAGHYAFGCLLEKWPKTDEVIIVCGAGNNGGDGYIVAALAQERKLSVTLIAVADPCTLKHDAKRAFNIAANKGIKALPLSSLSSAYNEKGRTVIVDALLGTGLNAPVQGDYAKAIDLCNRSTLPIMAIDIPSGLSANTGQTMGSTIKADLTCTFIGKKIGLITGHGKTHTGELKFDTLGAPKDVYQTLPVSGELLSVDSLLKHITKRPASAHKGCYGHVLLIGGNQGFGGAIALAAEACARMGAGLTSVATHPMNVAALQSRCPEIMTNGITHSNALAPLVDKATVIAIGPGLGQNAWSQQMLRSAVSAGKPIILDADALNLVAQNPHYLTHTKGPRLITPHPGEAARLLNVRTDVCEQDRPLAVRRLAEQYNCMAILKGSGTLISDSNKTLFVCPYGNPGMATGGMGDVLSGILAGLWAQSEWDKDFSTKLGVCLHAYAADYLAEIGGERGLLASDLIPIARALLNKKITCANDYEA